MQPYEDIPNLPGWEATAGRYVTISGRKRFARVLRCKKSGNAFAMDGDIPYIVDRKIEVFGRHLTLLEAA